MNTITSAVIALTLCAGAAWSAPAKEGAAKASDERAIRAPLVEAAAPALKAKTVGIIMTAEKECQCSKWEITYEEECTAYDGQGNCVKTQTVRRRKCIEWDHCHDKA